MRREVAVPGHLAPGISRPAEQLHTFHSHTWQNVDFHLVPQMRRPATRHWLRAISASVPAGTLTAKVKSSSSYGCHLLKRAWGRRWCTSWTSGSQHCQPLLGTVRSPAHGACPPLRLDFLTDLAAFRRRYAGDVTGADIVVDVEPLLVEPWQWATPMLNKARSCPWILWSKPATTDKMGDNAGVTPLMGPGGVPKAAHIAW